MATRRSAAPLRVVDPAAAYEPEDLRADPPETFIGPDYARLRRTDWGRLHARADAREAIELPDGRGRWLGADARRFER